MTSSEFKAWFEGFSEGIRGVPTKKQWERIAQRVGEITPTPSPWWPVWYGWTVTPRETNPPMNPLKTNITWTSTTEPTSTYTLDAASRYAAAAEIGKIEFERLEATT